MKATDSETLTADEVRRFLDYVPATGKFFWKYRTDGSAGNVKWNPRYAGKETGTLKGDQGYVLIKLNYRSYLAHRLAWVWMTGTWPPDDVDHKNGVKCDNRFENLRLATRSQNRANVGKTCRNTTGFKGVKYNRKERTYRAQIGCNGTQHYLGSFVTAEEAYVAYRDAAQKIHGQFAKVE